MAREKIGMSSIYGMFENTPKGRKAAEEHAKKQNEQAKNAKKSFSKIKREKKK